MEQPEWDPVQQPSSTARIRHGSINLVAHLAPALMPKLLSAQVFLLASLTVVGLRGLAVVGTSAAYIECMMKQNW